MQSETIVLSQNVHRSFSLTFSVTKQERSKYKSQIHWVSNQKTHTHKHTREREREIWKRGKGGEAQIGLSNQASKKGHRHGCNKNRLPRCDKKIHKEAIRVAPPSKTGPFNYTRNVHTFHINKAIVTASFFIVSTHTHTEREREKERIIAQKRRNETDTHTYIHTHTPRERERERERERYEIFFSFFLFGFWVCKRRVLGGWFEEPSWGNHWVQRGATTQPCTIWTLFLKLLRVWGRRRRSKALWFFDLEH